MQKQIDSSVELAQDAVDFRALLDVEILSIGGGDVSLGLY